MTHKAGFVNILGNPNVGKSTLMNELVGERLSIITSKSQTTRHRIMGIVNTEEYQIVFSDTPGVLKPNYKLQEAMLSASKEALADADVILYVTDLYEKIDKNEDFLKSVKSATCPVLIVINKIDLSNQEQLAPIIEGWKTEFPHAETFIISALHKFNVKELFARIVTLLPESPPYFEKSALTNKPMRFFVSEKIREKILLHYQKEIPYSVEVVVDEYKEETDIVNISAIIYVARDSQKGIIIGHQGLSLKRIGTEARKDLEKFIEKKIFLSMFVKVKKDWRDDNEQLQKFGYNQ
ncbi:MAG: GTPase Era [Bacteroidales bacterium]|nr:GTPase Era [Bacteroidales bacterium]